ncbi:hypothetical protein ACWCQL_30870 [Streptomyces sp. NPDC002073]
MATAIAVVLAGISFPVAFFISALHDGVLSASGAFASAMAAPMAIYAAWRLYYWPGLHNGGDFLIVRNPRSEISVPWRGITGTEWRRSGLLSHSLVLKAADGNIFLPRAFSGIVWREGRRESFLEELARTKGRCNSSDSTETRYRKFSIWFELGCIAAFLLCFVGALAG